MFYFKPRWFWSLQIAKKNKGKAKDVIDFPSYNYAQTARSHVKMFIIESYGLDNDKKQAEFTGKLVVARRATGPC